MDCAALLLSLAEHGSGAALADGAAVLHVWLVDGTAVGLPGAFGRFFFAFFESSLVFARILGLLARAGSAPADHSCSLNH
jgi:hypothetical protein